LQLRGSVVSDRSLLPKVSLRPSNQGTTRSTVHISVTPPGCEPPGFLQTVILPMSPATTLPPSSLSRPALPRSPPELNRAAASRVDRDGRCGWDTSGWEIGDGRSRRSNVNSATTSQLCFIGMSYQATGDGQAATRAQKKLASRAEPRDCARGPQIYDMTATAERGGPETSRRMWLVRAPGPSAA
jgi:hypothetical protein